MKSKYIFYTILSLGFCALYASCKKYLDAKPDGSLATLSTTRDLQLLLDNYGIMNAAYPYSTEIVADNYYLNANDWAALTNETLKNYYIWQKDDRSTSEWSTTYRAVFYANTVLDHLGSIGSKVQHSEAINGIKGAALFYRAHALYAAAQLFAPPYDSVTAGNTPGIPLRLTADFNELSTRATLQQTYERIVQDLQAAAGLLPATAASANRPSRPAAFAALARTLLAMENYALAERYADSSLQYYNTLLDYNSLNANASLPVPRFNAEVLFPAVSTGAAPLHPSRCKVDSVLYTLYAADDLRKKVFFKSNGNGTYAFKGSYDATANGSVFSGYTTGEVYLVKAECAARRGAVAEALDALNILLQKRWKAGTFTPFTAADAQQALDLVLLERRKELVFRGQRWTDLRRLNRDSRYAGTLQRRIDSQFYSLPPNSPRYTLAIPKDVIDKTGMPQNP